MDTHSARSRARRARRWGLVLIVVVATTLLIAAAPAGAAPPPTLGLDGLQAELTALGSVDGYMKTTMSGTAPTDVPVKILAIVDGFSWGRLIMFESADPAITGTGGIAAGMSGSPIYVDVDGTDRIVGAVSYGDWFTLRGTGLATPIEYMTALQDTYAASASAPATTTTVRLDHPVATSTGIVRRLVLDENASSGAPTAAGTSVMHPLALARVSGLPAGSATYKKLAAKLEDGGLTVVSGSAANTTAATPDLEPGGPCGVVFSTGDFVLSVLGTVTYVDGDTALLFGHPILGGYSGYDLGLGPIEGTLTGATVQGVWPSTYEPYKMMSPADAKGVAVQDRSAGVVAHLGGAASSFPVTTHVSLDGGAVVDEQTDLGHWFATEYYPEIADDWGDWGGATTWAASAGLYHALASDPLVGSASTRTTVVVNDGTQDYTITRDNVWDNNGDLSWMGLGDAAVGDVTTIVGKILDDPYGTRDVTIESVDVSAGFSSTSRYAGITDATTPRAIRAGKNEIDVSYYRYGSAEKQTLQVELDVPAGTRLSGTLDVMSASLWSEYYGYVWDESAEAPITVAKIRDLIAAMPTNGDLVVAYFPDGSSEDDWSGPEAAGKAIMPTDWVFSGGVEKQTASVSLRARPSTTHQREPIRVSGYVRGTSKNVPVAISMQETGAADPVDPVTTVMTTRRFGMSVYSAVLPPARRNVLVTAEVPALSDDSLPGAAQRMVNVRARTSLTVVRRGGRLVLTARVTPRSSAGAVVFERRAGVRWRKAGSAGLLNGTASLTIRAGSIFRVRARYTGGDANAASAWATRTVK